MKLLLVGRSSVMRELFELLRQLGAHEVRLCQSAAAARRLLQQNRQMPDALIRESSLSNHKEDALTQWLRQRPHGEPPQELELAADPAPPPDLTKLVSAVENNRCGPRVLNCRLVVPSFTSDDLSPNLDQIIFEYQAPCRKTGT